MFRLRWILVLALLPGWVCAQPSPRPPKPKGSISGRITVSDKPVVNAVVTIELPGQRHESVITDKDGRYACDDLPSGLYFVSVFHPVYTMKSDDASVSGLYKPVDVKDGRVVADFGLVAGGVIAGLALDPTGQPAVGQVVIWGAIDGTAASAEPGGRGETQTDDRGQFRLYALQPGKYWIAIGNGNARTADAFQRTYYPRALTRDQASEIAVSSGEETDIGSVTLLPALSLFTITGQFINDDLGQPLPNFKFSLVGNTSLGQRLQSTFDSDATGHFTVRDVPDGDYQLTSAVGNNNPKQRATFDPFRVSVGGSDVADLMIHARTQRVFVKGEVTVMGREFRSSDCQLVLKEGDAQPNRSQPVYGITVAVDGSFQLNGLRQTQYTLFVIPNLRLKVSTIVLDGQPVYNDFPIAQLTLDLTAGSKTIGVQLVSADPKKP